jgi:uncharacterized membrane protein
MNKSTFRKKLAEFHAAIKKYRKTRQYHIFSQRKTIASSISNSKLTLLSSSSFTSSRTSQEQILKTIEDQTSRKEKRRSAFFEVISLILSLMNRNRNQKQREKSIELISRMKDITSQMLTFVKEIIRKTIANATTTTIAAATATATVVIAAAAAADKQEFSESKESAESSDHASQVEETSR